MPSAPIRVHPDNPRLFEFRDRPLALIGAGEHYGSVFNRPFDFAKYLREHARRKHTVTRLFLLFRELQSAQNPHSPCKPESPDFVAPWPRTGPGKALDGEPKYDLTQWNPEYFDRLHRFFALASDLGVIVEATLFSNTYADNIYALNPLRAENNLQGVGTPDWRHYNMIQDNALWDAQQEFVRKVVAELNPYDNFYWEVCNEPGAWWDQKRESVDAWQREILALIRAQETGLPQRHLVFGTQAFQIEPWCQENDEAFAMGYDAVNVHPLPNTRLGGRAYDMGAFMSGQLKLAEVRDFCLAAARIPTPCAQDEDNVASCYRDTRGWTIHRKRAWTTVLCGSHYDYIDFSIVVHAEDGTDESRRQIRSWIGYLSEFAHSLDLPRALPLGDWLLARPEHLVESTLAVEGEDYAVYLADAREGDEAGAGSPINSSVRFTLPKGTYLARFFSPTTGLYSPGVRVGGGEQELALPDFQHDIALRLSRVQTRQD